MKLSILLFGGFTLLCICFVFVVVSGPFSTYSRVQISLDLIPSEASVSNVQAFDWSHSLYVRGEVRQQNETFETQHSAEVQRESEAMTGIQTLLHDQRAGGDEDSLIMRDVLDFENHWKYNYNFGGDSEPGASSPPPPPPPLDDFYVRPRSISPAQWSNHTSDIITLPTVPSSTDNSYLLSARLSTVGSSSHSRSGNKDCLELVDSSNVQSSPFANVESNFPSASQSLSNSQVLGRVSGDMLRDNLQFPSPAPSQSRRPSVAFLSPNSAFVSVPSRRASTPTGTLSKKLSTLDTSPTSNQNQSISSSCNSCGEGDARVPFCDDNRDSSRDSIIGFEWMKSFSAEIDLLQSYDLDSAFDTRRDDWADTKDEGQAIGMDSDRVETVESKKSTGENSGSLFLNTLSGMEERERELVDGSNEQEETNSLEDSLIIESALHNFVTSQGLLKSSDETSVLGTNHSPSTLSLRAMGGREAQFLVENVEDTLDSLIDSGLNPNGVGPNAQGTYTGFDIAVEVSTHNLVCPLISNLILSFFDW